MSIRRAATLAFALVACACAGAPPAPPRAAQGPCEPSRVEACEQQIAAGSADRATIASYVAAREARDPADVWAKLHRALGEGGGVVVIAEGGAGPRSIAGARVIESDPLPAPRAIAASDLLLAMAEAAGVTLVIRCERGAITELFPGDPLAPFMAGIRPMVRAEAAQIEADVALAARVRAAIEAASSLRYVDAAREADRLQAAIVARGEGEAALRARYAWDLLGHAGLVLDAEGGAPAIERAASGAPIAGETPYAAYLAIVTAKDARAAWPDRAARVLEGIAPDRRDAIASLFARPSSCDAVRPPPMEGARDLVFASRLAASLATDASPRAGELDFAAWIGRYEAMVALVERTRTAWSFLPSLLAQRGDATGLGPASSSVYRRVTEMGLAHIAAATALEQAEPVRHRALSLLGAALAPGLVADPALERAMEALMEASVKDKLAAAGDPDAIMTAVAAGAIAGLSFPPAPREAHFGALQAAVTAKLRGDLLRRAGWGVAALYAIDAGARILLDSRPDLDFSARQIARALGDRDLPHPALAALASAGARYAALAAGKKLDPAARRISEDRRAARDAMREAIAGLGDPGEAPPRVLDDITELADGLIATFAAGVASSGAKRAASRVAAKPTCGAEPSIALDPGTRRALARLGDVRLRVLEHPRFAKGEGRFVRRARALVVLLSDAMDLAIASDTRKAPAFRISPAEADAAWRGALGDDAPPGAADAIAGGYATLRAFASSRSTEAFAKKSGRDLARLARGLLTLFGDGGGGAAALDVIARADAPLDLAGSLVSAATALYAANKAEQADLCLLGVLVVASLTRRPPPLEAVALAEKARSRVAWALSLTREIKGSPTPDPAVYADALRGATDDACQVADAEATLAVARAMRDFAAGKRAEARAALDRVLELADERGLGVPRVAFRYEEKTASKVFSADVEVSYASGLLLAGQTFQLGVGLKTGGDPGGSLSVSRVSPSSPRAGEDAARYYVYTAALAAVYHLLDHDRDRAIAAARRAISALSSGVKLGPRRVRIDRPALLGADAREILIVAAELAAEAGMPFLAGDLFTVVRQGLADNLDDHAVASMLDRTPTGLAGLRDLDPVIARARRSLKALAEPLACTTAKVELGAYEEVACDAYPLALALRIADALPKLPRLKRGAETTATCPAWKSLDAFLAAQSKGNYDPDAFTRAVGDLVAAAHPDDAAVLLARHKREAHCSPAILAHARSLGRSRPLGPSLRADLLSRALNCAAAAGGADVDADILALDDETQRLASPAQNLALALSIADLASRTDRWDTLGRLVDRPDFVGRFMSVHPTAAAAALLLDHAAAILRGREVDLDRTRAAHRLLCEAFPSPDRADVCRDIAALRASSGDRPKLARDAVRRLVASSSSPNKR